MANKPIKITILADAGRAYKEISNFGQATEQSTNRVVTGLSDSKLQGGFGRVQEGFDQLDQKAMGFRDTVTGVQDSLRAYNALTTSSTEAKEKLAEAEAKYGKNSDEALRAQEALADTQLNMYDKLLLVGNGVGDLASGFVNLLIPMAAMGASIPGITTAFKALNLTMFTNPVFLVVAAIVALVAVFVIAYKKSETFRNIVNGLWGTIKRVFSAIPGFVKGAISGASKLLLAWPKFIIGIYAKAGSWLVGAGKAIVQGLWNGISSLAGWIRDKVAGLADWLPGWVKSRLGIQSPSRVFKVLGQYTAEGFGEGFAQRAAVERGRVRRSFDGIADVRTINRGAPGAQSAGLDLNAASTGDPVLRAIIRELQKAARVNGSLGVA